MKNTTLENTTLASMIAFAVIVAGCTAQQGATMEKKEGAMTEGEWTPEEIAAMEAEHETTMTAPSNLHDFTQAAFDQAMQDNKVIVLFFNANWCGICKAELPHQESAFNEVTNPNVIGFRVHYKDDQTDAAQTALAKEYGIAYQHTKIIIKDGKVALKSPEAWDKERILAEIAKVVG